jgi:hypothetical protein
VYERTEIGEAAFIAGYPVDEIRSALKRAGRWDRPDQIVIVIPTEEVEA